MIRPGARSPVSARVDVTGALQIPRPRVASWQPHVATHLGRRCRHRFLQTYVSKRRQRAADIRHCESRRAWLRAPLARTAERYPVNVCAKSRCRSAGVNKATPLTGVLSSCPLWLSSVVEAGLVPEPCGLYHEPTEIPRALTSQAAENPVGGTRFRAEHMWLSTTYLREGIAHKVGSGRVGLRNSARVITSAARENRGEIPSQRVCQV